MFYNPTSTKPIEPLCSKSSCAQINKRLDYYIAVHEKNLSNLDSISRELERQKHENIFLRSRLELYQETLQLAGLPFTDLNGVICNKGK